MKRPLAVLSLALACTGPAFAADQEETFTIPELGADYVDGAKLSKLMERSDPKAATNIGWLFARGEGGVKQDYKEALQWWKFAAGRGYTPAMNNVGLLYANGHGVAQDFEEAFKWWMRAAERGDAWAMNAVGDLYENGQGVQKSYELALTWYREAAREGDGLAFWNVGHMLEEGLGTTPDPAGALESYVQSAAAGHAPAMVSIGRLHREGRIAGADRIEAGAWHLLAQRRLTAEHPAEIEENRAALEALRGALGAEGLAAAEARALALDAQYPKPAKRKAVDGRSV